MRIAWAIIKLPWVILKWCWKAVLKGEELKIEAMHRMYGRRDDEDKL